jgi:hypothetical protein
MRAKTVAAIEWILAYLVLLFAASAFSGSAQTIGDIVAREAQERQAKQNHIEHTDLRGLEALSDKGDSDASMEIGKRYELGKNGLGKNLLASIRWYEKAGEQGDCDGPSRAAGLYWVVKPPFKDWLHTTTVLQKAYNQGCAAKVGYALGEIYRIGLGVSKDIMQARVYYKVAASIRDFEGKPYDPRAQARLDELARSKDDPMAAVGSMTLSEVAQKVQGHIQQWSSVSYRVHSQTSDVSFSDGPIVSWEVSTKPSPSGSCDLNLHSHDTSIASGSPDRDVTFNLAQTSTAIDAHQGFVNGRFGSTSPNIYVVTLSEATQHITLPFYQVEQAMLVHKELLRSPELCLRAASPAKSYASTSTLSIAPTLPSSAAGPWSVAKKEAPCQGTMDKKAKHPLELLTAPIAAKVVNPRLYAVGDFNGDGKPDLAVVDATESSTRSIKVLLGQGDGTLGDFNGDGKLDVVVVNKRYVEQHCIMCPPPQPPLFVQGPKNNSVVEQRSVTVLLGNGDGSFTAAPSNPVVSGKDFLLTAGAPAHAVDFNGDGKLDMLVMEDRKVNILLGNGDGTFVKIVTTALPVSPNALAVGDFNGDGKPDLVLFDELSASATVMLGNGDGTFTETTTNVQTGKIGGEYGRVSVGDFNGDGKLDILAFYENGALTLLGNGDGTFTLTKSPTPGFLVGWWNAIGDFNGDGKVDVLQFNNATFDDSIPANRVSPKLLLRLGNGDGTFTTTQSIPMKAPYTPGSVAMGDFRGGRSWQVVTEQDNKKPVSLSLLYFDGMDACR